MIDHHEATHFCLFAGMGGLSLGLSRGAARIGQASMRLRCIGGIDVWPAAVRDFGALTGTPGTVLDLFDRSDYEAWHGRPPPADWREATVDDIRKAAGGECPDILATSAPCKGFSGLLSNEKAASDKYAALNRLSIRGLALALEAFADDPPALVLFENVPRIQTRGRDVLDTITALLRAHGYAVAETTHDCGELGGLAQHRRRFLLVARHTSKVQPFLYEPPKRRVRGIGEVIGGLPTPGADVAGAMHRVPRLTWQTWVRLALIEAGKDWRCLHDLAVANGYLRDLCLVPGDTDWHSGVLGVRGWSAPGAGPYSVADPRLNSDAADKQKRRFNDVLRLMRWDEASQAVTSSGRLAVADPRALGDKSTTGAWANAGFYGVVRWADASPAVTAGAKHDTGRFSVADPRMLPAPTDRLDSAPRIVALDRTWHRPLTTMELAALQGYPVWDVAGRPLDLDGNSDGAWRERIGNSVPVDTARAIGDEMARTLLLEALGERFALSTTPVWVRSVATAIATAAA